MRLRSTAIAAALFWAGAGLAGPAGAQDAPGAPVTVQTPPAAAVEAAPAAAEGVEFLTVMVEGLQVEVRARGAGGDAMEIEATPIFEALQSRSETQGSIIAYWRRQDGAVLTLDMSDGKVRANGVVLGALPNWAPRETADTWLGLNAIAVLTGTAASGDVASGLVFELDERLRPQFDLELIVNGETVTSAGEEPRTIGPILLLPLRPVVEALGHELSTDPNTGTVTVRRIQDSATITLELATGLVTVNGVPRGVSPDMAYADPDTLVLPFSAVETLTGAHVELAPGSSRVEVTLDDRLNGAALPGERIVDEAEADGFVAERLDFQIGEDGPQRLTLSSRYKNYNTVTRYETIGGFGDMAALQPSWIGADVRSLDGWVGNVGDYTPAFREFSGLSSNRVRGIAYRDRLSDGALIAIAAGVPLTGSEAVTDRLARPVFGGVAAGLRIMRPNDGLEYGIAAEVSDDGEDTRVAITGQTIIPARLNDDGEGFAGGTASYMVGAFDQPDGSGLDISAQAEGRYNLNDQVSFRARAAYDGESFLSGRAPNRDEDAESPAELADPLDPDALDAPAFAPVFDQRIGARTTGSASVDWRAVEDWTIVRNAGAGARVTVDHDDATGALRSSLSTSVQGALANTGVNVAATADISQSNRESTATSVSLRAAKRFDWGAAQAVYSGASRGDETTHRLVASASLRPITKWLGKGSSVSAGPNATALVTENDASLNFGANLSAQSGQAFGSRLRMSGQLSAISSVDPENTDTRLFGAVNANYRVYRGVELQVGYVDDFDGRSDITLGLRGSLEFNPPRRHTRAQEGRGVLAGSVFLDKNRDGIRQPDEPGVSRVRITVRGTRLALSVDREGHFTIQNMPTGLFNLSVDGRSLPLGYLVPESADPKATIAEGRITRLDIPVVASGQIRGAAFIDTNGDGEASRGEHRLEGHWIKLTETTTGETFSAQSATFGQYGFESLSPGDYVLEVNVGGRRTRVEVSLTEDDLFQVAPIAVPQPMAGLFTGLVEAGGVIAEDVEVDLAPVLGEP